MTTWRDQASALAQDDLDRLLDAGLQAAAELLAEHGEFGPFSMAVSRAGETELVSPADQGTGDASRSKDSLFAALRDTRSGLRAAVVVTDVRLGSGKDAIDLHLEHSEGPTLLVRAPYRLAANSLDVDERSAYSEPSRIWSA